MVGCLRGFGGYFSFDLVLLLFCLFYIAIKVVGGEISNFLDNFVKKLPKAFS